MRIGIIGYGKMGKRIAELAESKGHSIVCKIDSTNQDEFQKLSAEDLDLAIEFTKPDVALSNFEILANKGIPTVTGTTGWTDDLEKVSHSFEQNKCPFFYASNFSIGVFMTNLITAQLSSMMSAYPEYGALIEEWHHTQKIDAPSGTALTLAQHVISSHAEYNKIGFEKHIEKGELEVKAYRENSIPGTHRIAFDSDIDTIEIKHTAKSRDGFALGAIRAAEFLCKQEAGIYTMNDLIKI